MCFTHVFIKMERDGVNLSIVSDPCRVIHCAKERVWFQGPSKALIFGITYAAQAQICIYELFEKAWGFKGETVFFNCLVTWYYTVSSLDARKLNQKKDAAFELSFFFFFFLMVHLLVWVLTAHLIGLFKNWALFSAERFALDMFLTFCSCSCPALE